jgi:coenzyme F420-0:L-glutamate ligase
LTSEFSVIGVRGLPEVRPGDDLADLLVAAGADLRGGDIVVVTSKIVSKSEGRLVHADNREAAITAETGSLVAQRGPLRIVRTRHGLVLAAAGVDASNVAPGTVLLLPVDPDASARALRAGLAKRLGVRIAVIISDTAGRPWREGLVDIAIGVAGLAPLDDLRGQVDPYGNPLQMTVTAVADEIAAGAELVKGKTAGVPVAIVRGLGHLVTDADGPGAVALVRRAEDDLFALGVEEAQAQVRPAGRSDMADNVADGWRAPKDERLVPYGATNLGTPLDLVDGLVVPTDLFFVRSNYRVPTIDPQTWRLRIRGLVARPLDFSLADLHAMPQRTLVAFLECSGNSRIRFQPATPGTPWRDDAVGNAVWTGVRLADLLGLAGVEPAAVDVVSQGADDPLMRRGLPLRVALDPDTMLALQMNGEDLLAAHGAPARLVVPGWGGIASTKWVTALELIDHRWDGLWNAVEYVLIDESGQVTGRVEEMPVKSVVARPQAGSDIPAGATEVSGYAWSGHGQVELVEISLDGGRTYVPATITERAGPRAWVRWAYSWLAEPGQVTIRSRATDSTGATQPEVAAWNAKGYQMNAITEIELQVLAA